MIFNPSLTFNYPFFLHSSTLRFSFAVLCTKTFLDSDFSEWHLFVLLSFINIIRGFIRLAAKPHVNLLSKGVVGFRGDRLLRG